MEASSRAPDRQSDLTIGLRIPRVYLFLSLLAPGVERVVHHQAVLQHLVVVRVVARETKRDRREARGLRREVEPGGVGPAHDEREVRERRIGQAVMLQKSVEAAKLAV